jgi:6-pyruvoyltetrahydropterin/6-carboxytetrahydropterin synthase
MPKMKKNAVHLICKMHFDAAHRLHNPRLTPERNVEIYGPCNNEHGHGHNYVLEVHIRGEIDPATGYLVDLGQIKQIVQREVIQDCDHKNLNIDVPWLKDVIPTVENLTVAFWERLVHHIPRGALYKIRLFETDTISAEHMG